MAGSGGKREGAGRKSKAAELGLAELINSVWKVKDQKAVISKLAEDCNADDFDIRHESRKLLLAYKFGKPAQTVDLGMKDDTPLKVVVEYITK